MRIKYKLSSEGSEDLEENEKIDFVIIWVDGGDKEWQKERNIHAGLDPEDTADYRFRDWDNLKYWFRGVEKYAPWVNKVYFVTWGHLPKWLNTNNPKLVVVNHKDFIPEKYLPTFSANPIELNLHRIKGLSEQFVFFNDDMFLNSKVKPTDFFKKGLPCDTAILNVHCPNRKEMIYDMQINNVRIINSNFDMKKVLHDNKSDWFNFKYGLKKNLQNLVFSNCNRFPGFQPLHVCNAFLKSTYKEIWEKEEEELNLTCERKFRTRNDVNQFLIKDWQLVTSNFVPSNKHAKVLYYDYNDINSNIKNTRKVLYSKKYKMICLNDGKLESDFELLKNETNKMFEKKLPEKSSFEL